MDDRAASTLHPPTAFTLQEAAGILGVSLNTLRRRIEAGQVRAERVERPQGHVWRVHLDGVQDADRPAGQNAAGTLPQDAPSTLQQTPAELMRAEAMAAYTRSILEPLVARLAEQEAVIRDQAEQVGSLRARLDQAREQLRALEAPKSHQSHQGSRETAEAPNPTAESSDPPSDPQPAPTPTPIPPDEDGRRPWWSRWWPAIVGAGLVLGVMVAATG